MTKRQRLAEVAKRQKKAEAVLARCEKRERAYHESRKAKRLRRNVEQAIARLNRVIDEWNAIVMEDYEK